MILVERTARTERWLNCIFNSRNRLIAAPFVGDGGWPSEDVRLPADLHARAIPRARVHRLPGRDHQLNNDLTEIAISIKTLD